MYLHPINTSFSYVSYLANEIEGFEPFPKRGIKHHILLYLWWAQHAQMRAASSVWIQQ